MMYAIILVFLALSAAAAVARMVARRLGGRGRPDLDSGQTGDSGPAQAHPSRGLRPVQGDPPGSQTRGRATRKPVFNLGATPAPEHISPWPSDKAIRREFDLDTPDGHGRAA